MTETQIVYERMVGSGPWNGAIMKRVLSADGQEQISQEIALSGSGEGLGGTVSPQPIDDDELRELGLIE